jgi:hypothetical protein
VSCHFIQIEGKTHAAFCFGWEFFKLALAAATSVDLRLHYPHRAAQFLSGSLSFIRGKSGNACRNGKTIMCEDFFGLMFMNVHG